MSDKSRIKKFSTLLLDWYNPSARPMPWKGERDPYRIWISEVILHQTRVQQGWQHYLRFIARFPDVASLAAASADDVLASWKGLGYYRRALHLHAGANYIMEELKGLLPQSAEAWLRVKGIGPYSAAAIASFAYDEARAVLDGNVFRVLARVFCVEADPLQERKVFASLAEKLLPPTHSAVYNQAIMDLGATVCTPARPLCKQCPLQNICCSFKHGSQAQYPIKTKKVAIKRIDLYLLLIREDGRILLRQRPATGIYRQMWDLPIIESMEALPVAEIKKQLNALLPGIEKITPFADDIQLLTHRKLFLHYFLAEKTKRTIIPEGYHFYSLIELEKLPLPGYLSRLLLQMENGERSRG